MSSPVAPSLPDVLMLGAAKVGSTSLHEYLRDHPGVCLSHAKELYYFLPPAEREKHKPWGAIATPEAYAQQFAHRTPGQITVELSTNYYAYPEAAAIIKHHCPQVKLFMILRDPANRAFSSYSMRLRNVGDVRPVAEELSDRTSQFVQRGFYFAQIQAVLAHFPPEQLRIFFFEDLIADKDHFFKTLCVYLGIEPRSPQRNYHGRPGGIPKRPWLHALATRDNPIRSAIATTLKPFISPEKRQKLRATLVQANIQTAKLPTPVRAHLIDLYRDDITHLETFLSRDLSAWKTL
ncbi:sulfotransferase [Spirulina major CS-329]|uniref:sulfotransferase family protein n=1 Tax=Spirulina TaxID=1154 RepID=UPI00232E148E|nr:MULTISPECIES: sulfotransferase [Spirulina]MDB9496611.1 sulfotransferase [Spirulina subsalsa CS-330]MDB9502154.1 sulfotransferase [Spirulina major CS-329]